VVLHIKIWIIDQLADYTMPVNNRQLAAVGNYGRHTQYFCHNGSWLTPPSAGGTIVSSLRK